MKLNQGFKLRPLAIGAAVSLAAISQSAFAYDFTIGDATVTVGGIANAFYTSSSCQTGAGHNVKGTALGGATLACGTSTGGPGGTAQPQSRSTVIGNGLLPNMLTAGVKTIQDGYEITGFTGIAVAVATDSSIAQNNNVDVRQAYLTVGNADMGTVKAGRDYGVYGLSPILSDMTLIGVGAATQATQNGRVSLGNIGTGYSYVGTYGQMVYSRALGSGFKVDVGVMNPVNSSSTATANGTGPQYQGRFSFDQGGFGSWVSGKSQGFNSVAGTTAGTSYAPFTMAAFEVGGKYKIGDFQLLANYQNGQGLGMLADGDQGNLRTQHTMVQATYQILPKNKVGISWGLGSNPGSIAATGYANSTNAVHNNTNWTLGNYYSLTKSLTLAAEIGQTRSTDYVGNAATQSSLSLGAVLFF